MRSIIVLLFIFVLSACSTGTLAVKESNDWFSTGGASDRDFTQGIEVEYRTRDGDNFLSDLSSNLPAFSLNDPKVDSSSLIVGQRIYTPEDISATELQQDDNPYAGWLYGELVRHSQVEEVSLDTRLSVGVVGPSAQGEEAQSWFHELCDCQHPNGWSNQLKDEPAIMLSHKRKWTTGSGEVYNCKWDSHTTLFYRVGNVFTDATYTETYRLGNSLDVDGFSYYTFSRFATNFVAHNIFYDGNTYQDSHSVDKENIIVSVIPGIHIGYNGFGIDISFVIHSKNYEEQDDFINSYGLITLGYVS